MCDPLSIAGVALTAGSTFFKYRAAEKVNDAREAAVRAETARQDKLQRESIANFDQTRQGFDPETQSQRIQETGQNRGEKFSQNILPSTFDASVLGSGAPKVVTQTYAKGLNDAVDAGKDFATRLGSLGAFGDVQFDNNVALGRGAETQSRLGNFSQGSSRLLPGELEAANRKGSKSAAIGDILGAGGSVLNYGGSYGANPF